MKSVYTCVYAVLAKFYVCVTCSHRWKLGRSQCYQLGWLLW